jgi:hypothetical protein
MTLADQGLKKKENEKERGKQMNIKLNKIASVLAFIIGAMAVFAGGQVLLGQIPDYYVIDWLPIYNFGAGVVTCIITAILIWKQHKYAMAATIATLGFHAIVMVILQTSYSSVVAVDSIRAMTVRIIAWIVILTIMVVDSRKKQITR